LPRDHPFFLEEIEIPWKDLWISSVIPFPRRLPLIALSLYVIPQPILFEAFVRSWLWSLILSIFRHYWVCCWTLGSYSGHRLGSKPGLPRTKGIWRD
jgi:hypothetical protein